MFWTGALLTELTTPTVVGHREATTHDEGDQAGDQSTTHDRLPFLETVDTLPAS